MRWASFQWDDPLALEAQLTEEEKALYHRARDYAESQLKPRLALAATESFDATIFHEMGRQGFLGAELHGYGCSGWNMVSYGLVARALESVDSGYRTLFSVQSSLAMQAIYLYGTEEQKERYLPAMARGELLGCFGLTEPNHGSDPSGMETTATPVQGGYVLSGQKKWVGLAHQANVLVIWAKAEEGKVRGFVLHKGQAGLTTADIEGKLALIHAPTGIITLQNVFVPKDDLLPASQGLSAPFSCMNIARYAIAWGAWGAAESCWHIARQYVLERHQFNAPLASKQLIQKKLADMQTEIALGLQSCLQVGRWLDSQRASHEMISLIKRNATTKARHIAREARDMLGANGILDTFHVMRHMLNLEAIHTYEGTSDIHALILGRSQTGIPAF